jgi:hypothetical protein
MNYSKPEVNTIGAATTVIESLTKPPQIVFERGKNLQAAYDLDE